MIVTSDINSISQEVLYDDSNIKASYLASSEFWPPRVPTHIVSSRLSSLYSLALPDTKAG